VDTPGGFTAIAHSLGVVGGEALSLEPLALSQLLRTKYSDQLILFRFKPSK